MKNIRKIIGIIFLIIISSIYAYIPKCHNIYNKTIEASDYENTGILTNVGVKQEFVCKEKHLDEIRIKNTVFNTADNIILKYELKKLDSNQVVAQGTIPGESVKSGRFFKIDFNRVDKCKDEKFELFLYTDCLPDNAVDGVGFFYEPHTEKNTSLKAAGQPIENGTLILKTVTHRFDLETFIVFLVFVSYMIWFITMLYRLFQ